MDNHFHAVVLCEQLPRVMADLKKFTAGETMQQKIDYIHANPVRRGSVAAPEHWRYSSAHEWLSGSVPVIRCEAWR